MCVCVCVCMYVCVCMCGWKDGWMDALYFPFREYITNVMNNSNYIYTRIYTHLYDKMFIAMGSACLANDIH